MTAVSSCTNEAIGTQWRLVVAPIRAGRTQWMSASAPVKKRTRGDAMPGPRRALNHEAPVNEPFVVGLRSFRFGTSHMCTLVRGRPIGPILASFVYPGRH